MATEWQKLVCSTCGGQLVEKDKKRVCKHCGSAYEAIEKISEEEVVALNRATTDRQLLRFDEALEEYNLLLKKYPDNEMANWGALLCDYGIIYEQDYNGEYIPTCHRLNERPIKQSPYYKKLSAEHKESAEKIERLRCSIAEKAKKIQPYDVFICYKATEEKNGMNIPTRESKWARDIYEKLTNTYKLRVFFAEKSLVGSNIEYEPHIYAALKSAKLMFVLTTSMEHINATWVANEWKRYSKYIRDGEEKTLRVIYDNIEPYDLPKELQKVQAIDHNDMGWDKAVEKATEELFALTPFKEEVKIPVVENQKQYQSPNRKNGLIILLAIIFVFVGSISAIFISKRGSDNNIDTSLNSSINSSVVVDNESIESDKNNDNSVNEHPNETIETIELYIGYLPEEIEDYSLYQELIEEAYELYSSLSVLDQNKVENKDKLLIVIAGYNQHVVENFRGNVQEINSETVKQGTLLADTVNAYRKLTLEQKEILSTDERLKFDNYDKVYQVINAINEINDDVVGKYGNVNDVKKIYFSINPIYNELVYNYSLIATFEDKIAFFDKFVFDKLESGCYSIAIKDANAISGVVELPAKYNGADVIKIPENAFSNCINVTTFIIPNTITEIGGGAFKGCTNLQEISIPFIGKSLKAEYSDAVFGFIFGCIVESPSWIQSYPDNMTKTFQNEIYASSTSGGIWQYSCLFSFGKGSYYYFIPTTLRKVIVTKQTSVPTAAFNGCEMLTEITFIQGITWQGTCAFQNCPATINK